MNPTWNHEVEGSIPVLTQWVKDLALLWLWCRLAAIALIRPLAWEPPYAAGVGPGKVKKKKNYYPDTKIAFKPRQSFSGVCFVHHCPVP